MAPTDFKWNLLQLVEKHDATGAYLEDTIIADDLGMPLDDVQRQMVILENQQLLELVKAFGPSYGARLTASGMEALEAHRSQPTEGRSPAARQSGFKE